MDSTPPLVQPSIGSPLPSPSDHLRLLIELLRPMGPELGRRWLAALLLVPEEEREALVEAVEARIVQEFGTPSGGANSESARYFTVVGPQRPRDGYVEHIETTYERLTPPTQKRAGGSGAKARHAKRLG